MAESAHLDGETRSAADLRRVGAYKYMEHPSTALWLFCYRLDHDPVMTWRPGDAPPYGLLNHIASGKRVVAHNAAFERLWWNTLLSQWPKLTIEQMDCSMARALALHLPGDLDSLAKVLQLPEKDTAGSLLMKKMARPRKIDTDGSITWWNSPENIARLGAYCVQDVVVESEADQRLPALSADERRLWELDQRINDRGFKLDVPTIERCIEVLDIAQAEADARMNDVTGGEIKACTEAGKLVKWFVARGCPIDSIAKDEHAEIRAWCKERGDNAALTVLDLRVDFGKSSTAKYRAMLDVVCADGRAHGQLRYHAASTGRWGGALVQPQNLPRVDEDRDLPDVREALNLLVEET